MNKKTATLIITVIALVGALYYFYNNNLSQSKKDKYIKTPQIVQTAPSNETPATSLKQDITLALSKKYNKLASSLTVTIIKETDKYAKGSITFTDQQGSGGLWFAAKTENGWELAFEGNGIMDCAIANKYNFPKDIVSGCVDFQNGSQFVQR
jgi:hypothetical protein